MAEQASDAQIDYVVTKAVDMFLGHYRKKA
jgi:hypothetical protein